MHTLHDAEVSNGGQWEDKSFKNFTIKVSFRLLYQSVSTWWQSQWCSKNLCGPFLSAMRFDYFSVANQFCLSQAYIAIGKHNDRGVKHGKWQAYCQNYNHLEEVCYWCARGYIKSIFTYQNHVLHAITLWNQLQASSKQKWSGLVRFSAPNVERGREVDNY